jgi:PAT family beta-lactamase induction signal transducer AmpG
MQKPTWLHSCFNTRILAIFFLGFSSGLPLALTAGTLGAWYTEAGVSLMGIGLLSMVGQPYVYKFLWAPLMDRFIPPLFGRRRGWIFVMQILLILTLIGMAMFSPHTHPVALAALALTLAIFSASQDTSINAYQTDVLSPQEYGMGATSYIMGYRVAMVVSGSLALIIAQHFGFQIMYMCMGVLMLVGVVTTCLAPEIPEEKQIKPHTFKEAVMDPFVEFFTRKGALIAVSILGVMILYKLGDAFALSLNSTFILRGLHFSLTDLAVAGKGVGLTASIAGTIVGGLLLARFRLIPALVFFGILQALSNLMFMWLAAEGHNMHLLLFSMGTEYFAGGLGNTGFVALIMALCNARHTATQFALFSALTSVGRVYVGPVAAAMVTHLGWEWFYFWTFIIALPGTFLLFCIRRYFED